MYDAGLIRSAISAWRTEVVPWCATATFPSANGAFRDGATAEEIAEQYPAISLGQVYTVIA